MIDAHVHAWPRWPYPVSRLDGDDDATVSRLIRHLDEEGIDACWLIAADLADADGDEGDNAYAALARSEHPSRISLFVDVDSRWSSDHHRAGAPERLRARLDRHPEAAGVAHYLASDDDRWLESGEAARWLREMADRGLVLSLAAGPNWYLSIAAAAHAVPGLPVVLHHLAGVAHEEDLTRLAALADVPNVHVKLSGAHYLDARVGTTAAVDRLLDVFGVDRMVWGSDFPVDGKYVAPREARAMRELLLRGLSPSERDRVTHANAARLTLTSR
ncbi:amidohydrolase [Microbacterium sp. CFH 90308]|uniref:Amidohydrolase n=1 Tax=Microbacterium salsuginis TaxID=2722803 RepID=A0ABX1KC29_9MICO|nr:amidohydrolase family protein [Microbacterium sp. CFH 90308]NLP84185.1 amidohydrolase [Microbacterium sp. CFH 90308]